MTFYDPETFVAMVRLGAFRNAIKEQVMPTLRTETNRKLLLECIDSGHRLFTFWQKLFPAPSSCSWDAQEAGHQPLEDGWMKLNVEVHFFIVAQEHLMHCVELQVTVRSEWVRCHGPQEPPEYRLVRSISQIALLSA